MITVEWLIFILVLLSLDYSFGELECQSKDFASTLYVGSVLKTWKNRNFCAFRGIRYAQPPIGQLRFKDPHPFTINLTTVTATKNGNDCPSIYAVNPSEDCLYLNVYTNINQSDERPVLVVIHPGGLYIGSSNSDLMGPEYLIEKDLIVVTFNYRLGSLGFLNLGTEDIPGNAGFKDQVIALRWIKENIKYFGGNSKDVTLMGYSAGGLSVSLHLVSPMSVGLFQKAIIMSGSIPPQTTIPTNDQFVLAQKQALVLGCIEVNDTTQVLECLNKFNGTEISATLRNMFDFGKDNPIFLWLPIIEKDFGQERFLTANPYDLFKSGRFIKVPILTGFTDKELCESAMSIMSTKKLKANFLNNFDELAPICFMYQGHPNRENITKSLQNYYRYINVGHSKTFEKLCDVFSDSIISFGVHRLADIASQYVDVYSYKFTYTGGKFINNIYTDYPIEGAYHMDDFKYLFRVGPSIHRSTDSAAIIIEEITEFFTQFAITGKPDSKLNASFNDGRFYEIANELQVHEGRSFINKNFWDALVPLN